MGPRRAAAGQVRYVALLRGVSPMNASMPALKRCFENAGFTDVKTLLTSGNVAFSTRATPPARLERRIEAAMASDLERSFVTIVRPSAFLQALLAHDPFAPFDVPAHAKRVVTFLRRPTSVTLDLPIERDHARILAMTATEIFSTYVPGHPGAAVMGLIERSVGTDITTRTIDTVRKCAQA